MGDPIPREMQIELMETAAERHDAVVQKGRAMFAAGRLEAENAALRSSLAAAARLLLDSPEAVERMARANPLDQMAVAMADADGDTLMVDALVRAIIRRALRSIAGEEG